MPTHHPRRPLAALLALMLLALAPLLALPTTSVRANTEVVPVQLHSFGIGSPIEFNGKLFFTSYDDVNGHGLWQTDGSIVGTQLLKGFGGGQWNSSSIPRSFAVVGSTLFFSANDSTHGYELWKSDGSESGTVLVKDINLGSGSSNPGSLTAVGNTLFFVANDGVHGNELWKSDGTEAGTVLVKDLYAGTNSAWQSTSSFATNFYALGNTLLFTTDDGVNGYELWRSDGTSAGTTLVKDIYPGVNSAAYNNFRQIGNLLFFSANDGVHGQELWRSDGTTAGTFMLKDINTGVTSSTPRDFTVWGSQLFFFATDGSYTGLWKSNGTVAGTVRVAEDVQLYRSWSPPFLFNNVIFFYGSHSNWSNQGLWKSDGTSAGTVRLKGLYDIEQFTPINNTLFFRAADYSISGNELWKTDGTAAGTQLVKDIYPGTNSSEPSGLTAVNNMLLFSANNGTQGYELWKSDGTAEGTVMVRDINPLSASSTPSGLFAVGDTVFFNASAGGANVLWKSDGTYAGTVQVWDNGMGFIQIFNGIPLLSSSGNDIYALRHQDSSLYTISGRVTDGDGNPIAGATVAHGTTTTLSGTDGSYSFNVTPGSYTLTATKEGCSLNRSWGDMWSVSSVTTPPNIRNANFVGSCSTTTYSVSGRVTASDGSGLAGVTISDGVRSTTTDANGDYTIAGLYQGSYTITPSRSNYNFSPSSRSVSMNSSQTGVNFTATQPTYSVSGRITTSNGSGLAGVTVSDGVRSTTTDSNGGYTLANVPAGSHTITPQLSSYSFTPASRSIGVSGNLDGQDFSATGGQPVVYSVAGRVTTSNGSGLAGVTVSAGTRTATTNASGDYTLAGVPAGSHTLVPALAGYSFSPNSRSVSISANLAAQDFTATPLEPQGEELVQSLTPSEGLNNQATAVTVRGNGFATTTPPIARLLGTAGIFALTDVAAETTTRFSANVPAGLEPGLYDLIVTSNGRTGILPNAFMVLSPSADPFISTVVPDAGFNDRPVEVVIQGANFGVGAVVYLGETMLNSSRLSSRSLMAVVPAGVAPGSYSLRVTNDDGKQVVLANGYTVLDAASELNDDLLSNSDYLWLDPVLPRVNHPVQLGLLVERMGGKNTLEAVEVLFRRDAADGPELGRGVVNFLDPRSMESTTPITVTFDATGEVTIYAIIDPDGVIAEHNEQNNIVQRTIIVAPAGSDQVPPVVEQIRINGGAEAAVTAAQISVDVRASDPAPGSDVGHVNIIEYIYSDSIKRWVAIERSAWLPYLTTPANYRWTLQPLAGMRYIQVRARDGAGNISIGQARRLVNYIVSNDRIARDQTRVYRYMLAPGQAFEVNLEVIEGDADLYVWSSQADQSAWASNQSGSVNEQVRIAASQVVPGLYQVEVYGYSAASYRLTTNIGASAASSASLANGGVDPSKTPPTTPVVPLSSLPSEHMGNLPVAVPELEQPATGTMVYLPLVRR
ncbi:MAG: hypothetical protein EI684_22225 [Candidatus Viridilinea halotolerans]|uniref:IPT/TIG domain-containing protein n=1 Tax=Candidatus Viridilinea halotolerans TaxID=2491704 RepID=A0A426TQY2_9CHLR|nr:MAG: hypothetical protein EI684_22225 [Candidatus Viridilinea halotolerans]